MKELRIALALLFGNARFRRLGAVALGVTLLGALMPSLPPLLMKRTIDDGVLANDSGKLLENVALYMAAVVLELALQLGSQTALATLGQSSMHGLRRRLFHHLQTLDLAYFEREPRGRILTRVTSDVEALSEMFTSGAVTMVADFVVALCIVAAMFLLDVRLTLITFLTVPPLVVLAEVFRRKAASAFRAIRARVAKVNAFASEHLAGAEVIAAFGQARRSLDSYRHVTEELQEANKRAVTVDASLFAIVEAIGTTAVAAMLWFAAPDLLSGVVKLGVLVAFVQYVQRFFVPIRDLSAKFAIIQSGLAAAERVDQFLKETPAIVDDETTPTPPATLLPLAAERLSFAYPSGSAAASPSVLSEVSLTIAPGKKTALVGATGSGKTTLVKLLLRLVEPSAGRITANGTPIGRWPLQALRDKIAIVTQEPIIFAGTLRDNLAMFAGASTGDAAHAIRTDDAALLAAAEAIGAAPLIARLGGLGAMLTERGSNLSSGEAQLLAFTRALVRAPELLILDEATSSIDATTEALVSQGLRVLLHGRAALVIAHRLATLRMADEIVVLHEGRVSERGTHEELIAKHGIYAALYALQFQAGAAA